MGALKPKQKFYVGQQIVVDDYCIDRLCATPDVFMSIPELQKFGVHAENVPLRREATFTGYIVDQKEKFVNRGFAEHCYKVRLDAEQKSGIIPISQREFWTTEDSYARRIRKA